jgi:hypothetical protein
MNASRIPSLRLATALGPSYETIIAVSLVPGEVADVGLLVSRSFGGDPGEASEDQRATERLGEGRVLVEHEPS